jgi:hypothetical protein
MAKKSQTKSSSVSSKTGKPDNLTQPPINIAQKVTSMTESSLFGSLDLANIGGELENGTYLCTLDTVKTFHQQDKPSPISFGEGKHWLIFEWTVSDDNSDYFGETIQQWYAIFPGITNEEYAKLSGKDKNTVRKSVDWLRMQLRNIGMSSEEINQMDFDSLKYKEGITKYLDITVTPNDDGKSFTKVRKISDVEDSSSGNDFGF